jgi:hypothetical protein
LALLGDSFLSIIPPPGRPIVKKMKICCDDPCN